jgi:hypothetical protein
LPNGNSSRRRRKPAQNGVQAIFTNEDGWLVKTAGALAIVTLGAGSSLWAWLALKASGSLTLVSSSLILLVIGVASGAYSLAVRHGRHENDRIRSALYELEVLAEPKIGLKTPDSELEDNDPSKSGLSTPRRFSKTLAIAVAEAVVLIIIYSGLVEEYTSNLNMQQWVRSNIAFGAYVLNFNAVFVLLGGLIGTVLFQSRLGRNN